MATDPPPFSDPPDQAPRVEKDHGPIDQPQRPAGDGSEAAPPARPHRRAALWEPRWLEETVRDSGEGPEAVLLRREAREMQAHFLSRLSREISAVVQARREARLRGCTIAYLIDVALRSDHPELLKSLGDRKPSPYEFIQPMLGMATRGALRFAKFEACEMYKCGGGPDECGNYRGHAKGFCLPECPDQPCDHDHRCAHMRGDVVFAIAIKNALAAFPPDRLCLLRK
jgi:hypothetical protein